MKIQKSILAVLSTLAFTAGLAIAGPSNPSSTFTGTPQVSPRTGCPMIQPVAQATLTTNPKGAASASQTVGYRHEGCTRSASNMLTCKTAKVPCASMRQG